MWSLNYHESRGRNHGEKSWGQVLDSTVTTIDGNECDQNT